MKFIASALRIGMFVCLSTCALAQTAVVTTRGTDGKVQVRRQNSGAYLGAYLGDAGRGAGAVVGKVLADSPAAKAGLQENDLLLSLAAQRIENAAQVYQWLTNAQPNQSVALRIRRGAAELTLNAQLGERSARTDDPCQKLFSETNALLAEAERLKALADEAVRKGDQKTAAERTREADSFFQHAELSRVVIEKAITDGNTGNIGRKDVCLPTMLQSDAAPLGLTVAPLTPQLATYFGVTTGGVLITQVEMGSLAARAGMQVGDCLTQLSDKPVTSANELKLVFEAALNSPPNTALSFTVVRQGQPRTLQVARR